MAKTARSAAPAGSPADCSSPARRAEPDPDLLAAVVLHILVGPGDADGLDRDAPLLSLEQIALACERDPALPAERGAVRRALQVLIAAGLARPSAERFSATQAALRAAELSF